MCSDHPFHLSFCCTLFYLNQHAAAARRASIRRTRRRARCRRPLLFRFQFGAQSGPNHTRASLTWDSINSTPTSGEKRDSTVVLSQGCLGHSLIQTAILLVSQILLFGMIFQGMTYHQLLDLGRGRLYPCNQDNLSSRPSQMNQFSLLHMEIGHPHINIHTHLSKAVGSYYNFTISLQRIQGELMSFVVDYRPQMLEFS